MDYFIIYKPFNVLSQFTPETEGQRALADLYPFPKDVYAVGRLDYDSEGLLILTNDKTLNATLLSPQKKHTREYTVQVEGDATDAQLQQLAVGVTISINGKKHQTLPVVASRIDVPTLPERLPAIRFRAAIPTTWLRLILTEGKNRQVRRMTAAVGLPTLRLVRTRIENLVLPEDVQSGAVWKMERAELYRLLNIR